MNIKLVLTSVAHFEEDKYMCSPDAYENNIYQAHRARRVLRAGGPANYYEVTEDTLFQMQRPSSKEHKV